MSSYTEDLCNSVKSLSAGKWRIVAIDLGDFAIGNLKDFYELEIGSVFTHEELCKFVEDFCYYVRQVAEELGDLSMLEGGVSAIQPVCSNNPYDRDGFSFNYCVTSEEVVIETTYVDKFGAANFRQNEKIVFRAMKE